METNPNINTTSGAIHGHTQRHHQPERESDTLPRELRPIDDLLHELSASWQRQLPPADEFNTRIALRLAPETDGVPGEQLDTWEARTDPRSSADHSFAGHRANDVAPSLRQAPAGGVVRHVFPAVAALLLVALGASVFAMFAAHRPTSTTPTVPVARATSTPSPTVPPITRVTAVQPQNTRLPVAANAYVQGISFSSANDGWVTGGIRVDDYAGADFSVAHSQLVHYHDGVWSAAHDTFKYGGVDLVSMVSADEGWAIGNLTSDVTFKTATPPTLLHYSGGHWQRAGTLPYAAFSSLRMLSPDFGYATGDNLDSTTQEADPRIIVVYNHGAWTPILSPLYTMTPMLMVSPSEGWGAGVEAQKSWAAGIYHYQNGTWSQTLPISASPGNTTIVMQSLSAASPRDIWATGTACAPNGQGAAPAPRQCQLVLYHFDGSKWSPMTPPNTSAIDWSQNTVSTQVFADETGAAWLSTTTEDDTLPSAKRQYQTVVYRYIAGQWQSISLPVPHIVLAGFSSDGNGGTWSVGWTENPYASYVLYTPGDGTWHVYGHN